MGFKDYQRPPLWVRIVKFVAWFIGLTAIAVPIMLLLTDL
jgi:hypothetical protein